MKEFEAKVVIVCMLLGALLLGLGLVFSKDKTVNTEQNNIIIQNV